ncbi:MAG: hypothetical protein IJ313_00820 [Clostridia bacterium]|nr:hypothetical protein [Clostridia bacterium]
MGTFADSLFTVLLSWVRGLVNAIWALFTSDHTTVLEFFGKNWLIIAVAVVAAGLVIDWIIWLLRWQPYHLWAQRARRLLRMEEPEGEEAPPAKARAAAMPRKKTNAQLDESMEIEPFAPAAAAIDEQEEEAVLERAQAAPDEYAYPGMRYDSTAQEDMGSTQRYGAVTQEGPGAAEVERRRAEIEAWQLQMQEEARARAEAEQARLAQEAYEAEQARLAQEAYEAEQARLAQEAYEAGQARLAQQEYERQLAQYELEKAQYALDLAEYERQKAEYEAELARQAAMQEASKELVPEAELQMEAESEREAGEQPAARRRRGAQKRYSDYVAGEAVTELPDAPKWPQMAQQENVANGEEKAAKHHKLLDRMAKIIEPEEEELAARTKLPPRVNMQDAYKPAAAPRKPGRRSRNV